MAAPPLDPAMVRSVNHFGPCTSLLFVGLELVIYSALLLGAVLLAVRWWRRARAAERSFNPETPLVPGEIVVRGVVEYAVGQTSAVRVEVEQKGSESEDSGRWATSWEERHRRLSVRPFYLRHASGRRIRVESTRKVELIDDMDGVIRVNLTKRLRVAELTPGEEVFAHGWLSEEQDPEQPGGYRGNPHGLVLRPGGRKGHLLLSSEPLGERFRRRARVHLGYVAGILAFGLVTNGIMLPYYSRLLAGQTDRAVVTNLKHIVRPDSEGSDDHDYRVWLELRPPLSQQFEDDVDEDLFNTLKTGTELPVHFALRGWTSFHVGTGATYHYALLFLLFLPLAGIVLAYRLSVVGAIAWYEGKLSESRSGRLRDSYAHPPSEEPPT
jgi:hypothetical protein